MPKKGGRQRARGAFDTWIADTRAKIKVQREAPDLIGPVQFIDCLKRALCRVSAYVNHSAPSGFATRDNLTMPDGDLLQHMEESKFGEGTFANFFCSGSIENLEDLLHPYDLASNFFYGSLDIGHATGVRHKRVNWTVTEAFLTHGYDGLQLPDYQEELINPSKLGPPALVEVCCTNYFARNLWHNYVHTVHHKINQANYRDFGGTARHAMDFEADNWSNILLIESYGYRVRTDNRAEPHVNADIARLLRQNKCDTLFSLRAGARKEDQRLSDDILEHLDENEWRFRRTVAGYVSGWLLVSEAAAAHVTVHHRGGLSTRGGQPQRTQDGLVVCVNGFQIPITGIDPHAVRTYADRREMLKRIGVRVESAYKDQLRKDSALQAYSTAAVDAMRHRLVPSQMA